MDRKVTILAVAGLIVTLVLLFIDTYLAGIVFIFIVVLVMSLMIMQDTRFLPDIEAELRDDAKAVILRNNGNATAVTIHAALVPLNIEFDVPSLAMDTSYEYPLTAMIEDVKVSVTFGNEKGVAFSKTFSLNSREPPYDPLKPMIPVFKWK